MRILVIYVQFITMRFIIIIFPPLHSIYLFFCFLFQHFFFFFIFGLNGAELQIEATAQRDEEDFYFKEREDMVTVITTMLSAG